MLYEEIFNSTYDDTYISLKRDFEIKKISIEDLEALLQDLYINQGNDMCGRGEIYDSRLNAQIAACQQVISEIK